MKKRLYFVPMVALALMSMSAWSCSKKTIEGSYAKDDTVAVERPGTPSEGIVIPSDEADDNTGFTPGIDSWGDGGSQDIVLM
ncbi:MAG: hypothetical protein K2N86_03495 [Rikenellaceae bacterium]|nr:hypothetical protein [Rikenellaceae bacterium]MDE7355943.1 hypothetical protein [Rikenellaceae bacterium]